MTGDNRLSNVVPFKSQTMSDNVEKFVRIRKKLLSATEGRIFEKQIVNALLIEINQLDYKTPVPFDDSLTMLLMIQLCNFVQPYELELVKNFSTFLVHFAECVENIPTSIYERCKEWAVERLHFGHPGARDQVLLALQSLLRYGPFEAVKNLGVVVGEKGVLLKFIPVEAEWIETHYLAMTCLEAILVNKESSTVKLHEKHLIVMRDISLRMITAKSNSGDNPQLYNKIVGCCLRILKKVSDDQRKEVKSHGNIGQIVGIVQAFMFHGIEGYTPVPVQCLRPAAMNIPESVYAMPRGKNIRNHKIKSRRQAHKRSDKDGPESVNDRIAPNAVSGKYVSDSDTSDTDAASPARMESKVRLGSLQLLHSVVQSVPSRDVFGYWPQIVATGSREDARVLSKCILREPVSKIRQAALTTITELLVGAKSFLMYAEDAEQRSSFVTFFGTVGAMLRELHSSISLLLSSERNIAVLTHALKAAAALAEGTPYARLEKGLATKLTRNCRVHIFHKDPTVRVAALSVFEALAIVHPITPEILTILSKQAKTDVDKELSELNVSVTSDNLTDNEVDLEDVDNCEAENDYDQDANKSNEGISSLLYVCLKNASNASISAPVRLESLKLIRALAFHAKNLIVPHLEVVAAALVSAVSESETQAALHAARVIETIAGSLHDSSCNSANEQLFWNIVFEPITKLAQHLETTLRGAACDCLGNISSNMLSMLPRERSILVITTLFGTVRDEESAVRASALRALGMLVELPTLGEDVGFLMDLADIVCVALEDENFGVRIKGAWCLANLCDRLVKRENGEDAEPVPLDIILPRLYETSVKASNDNDKVKCNAVRAVGSTLRLLHLCPDRRNLQDTTQGLDVLIECAVTGNDMKVRWNACRAIGFVLGQDPDEILPPNWRSTVFPALCGLVCDSPNFKVRTNAAWALSVCESYGKHIVSLWTAIVSALENSQHVPNFVEYSHRDALVEQLCMTLSHLAVHTPQSELQLLWLQLQDHIEDISAHMKHFQESVLPEKAGDTIKAKEQMEWYALSATTPSEKHIASCMTKLFEHSDCYDNLDPTSGISQ